MSVVLFLPSFHDEYGFRVPFCYQVFNHGIPCLPVVVNDTYGIFEDPFDGNKGDFLRSDKTLPSHFPKGLFDENNGAFISSGDPEQLNGFFVPGKFVRIETVYLNIKVVIPVRLEHPVKNISVKSKPA